MAHISETQFKTYQGRADGGPVEERQLTRRLRFPMFVAVLCAAGALGANLVGAERWLGVPAGIEDIQMVRGTLPDAQ